MPPPPPRQAIPGVKHIVAVSSGKGGVGKSTIAGKEKSFFFLNYFFLSFFFFTILITKKKNRTTVNLAVALASSGIRASILDADVHGPSVPRLIGTWGKRAQVDEETGMILPLESPTNKDGKKINDNDSNIDNVVRSLSMGNLVEQGAAAVWRGPMVMSAIETLTRKADWKGTDVMVIDMPPGTGDAHLSVAQRLPLVGAVVVATPQRVALDDAERGARGWRAAGVGVMGLVENMSGFACSSCGKVDDIFGGGGGGGGDGDDDGTSSSSAASLLLGGAPLLGKVPLSRALRVSCDEGEPIVLFSEERRRSDAGARASAEALEGVAAKVREILKI